MGDKSLKELSTEFRKIMIQALVDSVEGDLTGLSQYPSDPKSDYSKLSSEYQKVVDLKVKGCISAEFKGADTIRDHDSQNYLRSRISERIHQLRNHYSSPEEILKLTNHELKQSTSENTKGR